MKLGRRLILLLIVTLFLLLVADFALKMMQSHGDVERSIRNMIDPVRKPLVRFLRMALEFLEK